MKRLFLVIGCWLLAFVCINAQSLEQKKICALKWTLQQTFYNKSEGQQIAHLNVCDFKSFGEFQKNKLISSAISKVTDKTDLNRIKNITNATAESDILSLVPTGGRNEYKADLDKIKTQATSTSSEEEDDEVVEEKPSSTSTPEIKTVEEQQQEDEAVEDEVVEAESESAPVDGVSFLTVLLTCIGVYAILAICTLLFVRSRKNGQKQEEMVSMEQYRAERLRLMERIKSLEIEVENVKSVKRDATASKPAATPAPAKPAPATPAPTQAPAVKPEPKTEPKAEAVAPTVIPASQPNLFATQSDPVEVGDVQPARPKFSAVMFYPVPVDGVFTNGSSEIEPGQSLYMLKTSDDQNATFQILNTPEAIGSALVAMNDMVKPACKVLNNVAAPVEILAEKLGTAQREGDGWRIITKAEVRLI